MITDGSCHLVRYNFRNKLKMGVSTAHAKAYDDPEVLHNSSTCISQLRIDRLIDLRKFLIRDRRQVLVNHKQNIEVNPMSIDMGLLCITIVYNGTTHGSPQNAMGLIDQLE